MFCASRTNPASLATWLTDDPQEEARTYWRDFYPAMVTAEENIKTAADWGYETLDHFTLPPSAWWDEYYTPLKERVPRLRQEADKNPALAEILDITEREIAMYARYSDYYGYVFYLMRKSTQPPVE